MPTSAVVARAMHEVIEPINSIAYFAPEPNDAWVELGIDPAVLGYFAGRAAPLNGAPAPVVAAMFFNFSPALVAGALQACWAVTTPQDVLAARARAMQALYERLEVPTDGVAEATELARRAMAAVDTAGRPLAAANTAVAASGLPLADLWQAVTTLREYRGDGHVALLTTSGLSPVEAVVLFANWQEAISQRFLRASRAIDDAAWEAGRAGLVERGWMDDDGLTVPGAAWRQELENRTDELATAPWEALGADDSRRLFDLLLPFARAAASAYPRPYELDGAFPEG